MRTVRVLLAVLLALTVTSVRDARGQRGGGNWSTTGNDAQRTAWNKTDAKVSASTFEHSGFRFLWKLKLDNQPKQLNSLTQPLLLTNIISYKGFKALAFVGGSSDIMYAIDYDLSKMFWTRRLDSASTTASSLNCPGGLTAVTRSVPFAAPAADGGRGRGGAPPAGAPAGPPPGGPPPGGPPPGGRGGRGGGGGGGNNAPIANAIYAVSGSGSIYTLNPQTGEDITPPVRLLPANAKVVGSIFVDSVFYATTTDNCGGAANGAWAVDLASPTKTITTWQSDAAVVGSAGPAFGTDGTIYLATGEGSGPSANAIVALEPRTLKVKETFSAATPFTSSPITFQFRGKELIVAANKDGRLYVLDGKMLGGADHRTPLAKSPEYAAGVGESATGSLATWEDSNGTRWVLAPANNSIVAFKVVDSDGSVALQQDWTSRELMSPLAPMILNNVVFVASSGEYKTTDRQMPASQRAQRSQRAVLYALDASTGRELWNSGTTMTSFARGTGPSGGDSQVYVSTYDGILYAFGVPLEH